MSANFKDVFKSEGSQNWFKGALAVRFTADGIRPLTRRGAQSMHEDIQLTTWNRFSLPPGTQCSSCPLDALGVFRCPTKGICRFERRKCVFHKITPRACPNNVCTTFLEEIKRIHRHNPPSWKNTDSTRWCAEPWEVAKCYFPPDGYSHVTSADDTDFNGLISILINCKHFEGMFTDDLGKEENVCTKARDTGRFIRHAELNVDNDDLNRTFDILLTLLSDAKTLLGDPDATDAREKIKQLKTGTLTVTTTDITEMINEAMKSAKEEVVQAALGEVVQSATDRTVQSTSDAVIESATNQLVNTVSGEVVQSATGQVVQNASGEVVRSATDQVVENASGQVVQSATVQLVNNTSGQVIQSATDKVIRDVPGQLVKSATGHVMRVASETVVTCKSATDQLVQNASRLQVIQSANTSIELVQNTSVQVIQSASDQIAQHASGQAIQSATEQVVQNASEQVSQSVKKFGAWSGLF